MMLATYYLYILLLLLPFIEHFENEKITDVRLTSMLLD